MTTLSEKFTALESQLADQQTAMLGALSDVNATLSSIFDELDTIIINNSANAQALLAAIAFYSCCSTGGPLVPPTPGTGPSDAVGAAKCQRAQFFVDLFRYGWGLSMVSFVGIVGSINPAEVASSLAGALSDLSITTGQLALGVPTSAASQVATAWAAGIADEGSSTFQSDVSDAISDSALWDAVDTAIWVASSSSSALTAAQGLISASSHPAVVRDLLSAMLYSAWTNDIYAATPVVDASSYSGTACSFDLVTATSCVELTGQPKTTEGHTYYGIFDMPTYSVYDFGIAGDFNGWTFEVTDNGGGTVNGLWFWDTSDVQHFINALDVGVTRTCPAHSNAIQINTNAADSGGPFTITICPPAS